MNDIVVQRIRAARSERGLTQKDLADHLGKTQATISDLERGKVQVSASEVYQISRFLNKPIEYFFGEEVGDKEIQDVVAVLRKQPAKDRIGVLQITTMILQMQNLTDEVQKYPKGKEIPIEKVKEFYNLFVPFVTTINAMSQKFDEMREMFDRELKLQELDKPKTAKK